MARPLIGPAAPGVTAIEVDGSISLYVPRSAEVLTLNQTASDVWRLCTGEHTLDEIVETLAAAYAASPAQVRADVIMVVTQLSDSHALAPVDESPDA